MNLQLRLIPAALVLAIAVPLSAAELKVGDTFPPLSPADLTGAALPEVQGKVVLVDFCASWCSPCNASFPVYSRLQSEYGARGLVIVAVSVDEKPDDYRAFVKKLHPSFVVVNDSNQRLVSAIRVPAMPTSYLIDRSGKVISIHIGFHSGITERDLRQGIEQALGAKENS